MNKPDPAEVFSLDRRAVAQAFDRASASYDAAAALQERVRNELMQRLAELKLSPLNIHRRSRSRPISRPACWRVQRRNRAGCGDSSACVPTLIRCHFAKDHSTWSSAA